MAELKTSQNNLSVDDFLNSIEDPVKKKDCLTLRDIMHALTNEPAHMWGTSIVGFGTYHYKYKTGREGDYFTVGFSPRKKNLTIYIMSGFTRYAELMEKLGKYKTGVSCLYVNTLEDVDMEILKELISDSADYIKNKTWP